MDRGTVFREGILIVDDDKKILDEERDDDIITMEIIRQIANTIDPMIQLTVDTPSSHENKNLPILDIQACLNRSEENHFMRSQLKIKM